MYSEYHIHHHSFIDHSRSHGDIWCIHHAYCLFFFSTMARDRLVKDNGDVTG